MYKRGCWFRWPACTMHCDNLKLQVASKAGRYLATDKAISTEWLEGVSLHCVHGWQSQPVDEHSVICGAVCMVQVQVAQWSEEAYH